MTRRFPNLIAASWVIVSPPAGVLAASVSATDTVIAEHHGDNENRIDGDDDYYAVLINRLNVATHARGMDAMVRVDTTRFYDAPSAQYREDSRVERLRARLDLGALSVTGGDYFRQLGRGIVLSLRKEDEIGLDIALLGGELRYRSAFHEATLFGGIVNPSNLDAISQKHVQDPEDRLAGASYELGVLEGVALGLYGLYLQPQQRLLRQEADTTLSGGAYVEVPELCEWLSFYLEVDAQRKSLAGLPHQGFAGYGTIDVFLGDTAVLFEGIYMGGFRDGERATSGFTQKGSDNTALMSPFLYNRPPTLQRLEEEVLSNQDVLGARLKTEYIVEAMDLVLFINALNRVEHYGLANEIQQRHVWGGAELTLAAGRGRFNLSGGYRRETQASALRKSMPHLDLDYLQPMGGKVALHLVSNTEHRSIPDNRYWRGSTFLGVERAGVGGLTFEWGYDTQDRKTAGVRNHFFAGILGLHLIDALSLTATAGTQRGGLKCIAGVCREFPAFAGGRLEMVGRF